MNLPLSACLLAFLLVASTLDATPLEKLIVRRQSGETEKEATAAASSNNGNNNNAGNPMQPPARLYPDLPQQPPGPAGMYPFGAGPVGGPFQPNFHGAPTPFVPFSPQLTPGQLSDLQRRMRPPPPLSASERLQSQTFTNGLGRRLLAMIGLDQGEQGAANETVPEVANPDAAAKALQNATVIQQLNGGVQSIYGSLSKMYNSTVQQQLNLLQERLRKETENSTNPWHQRMTQQVPMFFKSMAAKVGEAQANLDRIWKQTLAQASGNGTWPTAERSNVNANQPQSGGPFSSFDRFMGQPNADFPGGNFFHQFGQSLGFGSGPQQQQQQAPAASQGQDLGSQLMGFWNSQVQPQIGMVRGQIARVWRDLTASGTLMLDPMVSRSNRNQFSGAPAPSSGQPENSSSSGLVDEVLKEIDISNSEYALLDSKPSGDQQQPPQSSVGSQLQSRLVTMQRDLNQLWSGLTNSLQNAIGNVRNTLNSGQAQPFGSPLAPMASTDSRREADPEENEISGKVQDLGKLQREADTVHDVLKQQQQQQQQRPAFGDRFRSFFNNVDLANEFNQLPGRFGDSMARFGTVVGDLWSQIPRRWDNLMENVGPQSEMARARQVASKGTTTTTTVAPETKPPTESEPTTASN